MSPGVNDDAKSRGDKPPGSVYRYSALVAGKPAGRNQDNNVSARTHVHRRALAREPVLYLLDEPGGLSPQADVVSVNVFGGLSGGQGSRRAAWGLVLPGWAATSPAGIRPIGRRRI